MKRILVGNVDVDATEESLRSAFESFGAVAKVKMAHTEGFALVEMKNAVQADRALAALDGTRLTAESPAPLFLVALPARREATHLLRTSIADLSAAVDPSKGRGSQAAVPNSGKRCTNTLTF